MLIEVYRTDPKSAEVCERLVDLDEGIQEWRYRHVKMVERTIGVKPGTGGSQGAAYRQTTLTPPLFPDSGRSARGCESAQSHNDQPSSSCTAS